MYDPREGPASLAIIGAAVRTINSDLPQAEAVAIRGERIVGVGLDREIRSLIGPRTEIVHLSDGLVLPGFQDAHVHPPKSGLQRLQCSLEDRDDGQAYLDVIEEYAQAHPEREWILGGGWAMPAFPGGTPRKESLDRVVPDRPVFLMNRDGHGAWVNSRALELAGIGRDTADPPDGRIEHESATGEPSGTLHEGATRLVERIMPRPTSTEWETGILAAQAHLHSLGITAWQDAWVTPATLAAYRALAERELLTARVVAALWWDRHRGEEQVQELMEQREWGTLGRLQATTVKIMLDGVAENFSAAMLEPYLDSEERPTRNRGLSFVNPEPLRRHVSRLHREGFQVHFHAIGDRSVRDALDAVEAAIQVGGRKDLRHHIAHLQLIHPEDIPRFSRLEVVANVQPVWACHEPQMDDLTIPFLGRERARLQYPFGSLIRSGARVAFGSDWSVTTADPLPQIEVAVTRIDPGRRGNAPFLPEERIDLPSAVTAFTLGSAYVNHLDHETGSIERGKKADLVALDRNIFDREAGPPGDARVVLTLVGGRIVHEELGNR